MSPINKRKLSIDFELYTEGEASFKQELITLMISNIQELKKSIMTCNEVETLRTVFHKIKPTIIMLNDEDVMKELSSLSVLNFNDREFVLRRSSAFVLCKEIVEALEAELRQTAA